MEEEVTWFEDESDPTLNSNVYEIAQQLVQKHFPGKNAPAHNRTEHFALLPIH